MSRMCLTVFLWMGIKELLFISFSESSTFLLNAIHEQNNATFGIPHICILRRCLLERFFSSILMLDISQGIIAAHFPVAYRSLYTAQPNIRWKSVCAMTIHHHKLLRTNVLKWTMECDELNNVIRPCTLRLVDVPDGETISTPGSCLKKHKEGLINFLCNWNNENRRRTKWKP